jgi:hypothetical protein
MTGGIETSDGLKRSARPTTAGRRPPRKKENLVAVPEVAIDNSSAQPKLNNIIIDGQNDDEVVKHLI